MPNGRKLSQRISRGSLLCALLLSSASVSAEVYLTTDEALALAFPNCSIDRQSVYLTDDQREAASTLVDETIGTRVVHPYVATCDSVALQGTAYFEVHRVRTLQETIMVVVTADSKVRRIEILRFDEPPDYIPREAWYEQFENQDLSDELDLKRSIQPVTGATLTAQATTDAVRRVLALHQVIQPPKSSSTTRNGDSR